MGTFESANKKAYVILQLSLNTKCMGERDLHYNVVISHSESKNINWIGYI